MHPALEGLEPKVALKHFSDILAIPRPSHKEDSLVGYIAEWATLRGFPYRVDGAKNISVKVPATAGYEGAKPVCLQAHTDMVYLSEAEIDEPIDIEVIDGCIRTKGQTRTLGADNSAGIVLAMDAAITASVHGPLELLFTSREEDDLGGAEAWRPDEHGMQSRLLINLDTPEARKIAVQSAGFQYVNAVFTPERESEPAGRCYHLSLSGFEGGHSGDHVHLNRGNAIKLLAELISLLPQGAQIVEFRGGERNNSIPASAEAVVRYQMKGGVRDPLRERIAEEMQNLGNPRILLETSNTESDKPAMTVASTAIFLDLIKALPSGVVLMNDQVKVVDLSTTLAEVKPKDGGYFFNSIVRGATEGHMRSLTADVRSVYESRGCKTALSHHGMGWKQKPGSPLVQSALNGFRAAGAEAELKGYHCGLELATLIGGDDAPRFDAAVSFGCQVDDEHARTERMSISSMQLAHSVLLSVLRDVAEGKV